MKFARTLVCTLALALLAGCATTSGPPNPKDPLEPFNRNMFSLNDSLDRALFKPVSSAYNTVFPEFFRTGVSNFFANVGDLWIGVNNLLQGKPGEAVSDVGRVVVNSTVGILGLFDVATEMGLKHHNEDFGQTLAVWGVDSGAYVVLPVFGPRTVRDSFGLVADIYANPVGHIRYVPTRNTMEGVQFLDVRANLTDASNLLDTAALDRYTFVRESYLQRRRNLIYDGDPPPLPPAKDEDDADAPAGSAAAPADKAAAPADKPAAPSDKPVPPSDKHSQAGGEPVSVASAAPDPEPAPRPRSVAYPVAVAALPDVVTVQPVESGANPGQAASVKP